ncbi:hypothetical protein GOP47_0009418 [Adiantum capillus-veneris]|uniref:Uncharacterized protein n=1 Tax=Adiantum capillus-veneris TaxID=13818 RepID=A0A9D4UXR3_ADICA|nr:hypothetical protein GOP47_0009418 [Adiantum capillus-veneris]
MGSLARRLWRPLLTSKPHARFIPVARLISYLVPPTAEEATAMDMIKYAKSLKSEEPSYSEAMRILQQGLSFLSATDNSSSHMAFGRLQLSLATIHAKMSNFEAAADCLKELLNSNSAPLITKGAALEALTALCLQLHQDKVAMDYALDFGRLWEKEGALSVDSEDSRDIKYEALALRRLAEMPNPTESSDKEVVVSTDAENVSAAAVLALAQFHHVQGNFSAAKELYEKAVINSKKEVESSEFSLSAMSMVPEAVHVGAVAGLGQLLTVTGDFEEAEQHLTHALKETEKNKGEKDPQVGVILACIGSLYEQRGAAQGSNEMLITEGMYKSALDLMKTPPLNNVKEQGWRLAEIVALTRARLGVALAPAQYRRSEVQKLRDWVEATWKNSRPLPELGYLNRLLAGESKDEVMKESKGKSSVVDVRLERVFYI